MTTARHLYPEVLKPTCSHEIIGDENRRYREHLGKDMICGRTATVTVDNDHYCAQHAKIAAGGQSNLMKALKADKRPQDRQCMDSLRAQIEELEAALSEITRHTIDGEPFYSQSQMIKIAEDILEN